MQEEAMKSANLEKMTTTTTTATTLAGTAWQLGGEGEGEELGEEDDLMAEDDEEDDTDRDPSFCYWRTPSLVSPRGALKGLTDRRLRVCVCVCVQGRSWCRSGPASTHRRSYAGRHALLPSGA
jgi:hypothetical protein